MLPRRSDDERGVVMLKDCAVLTPKGAAYFEQIEGACLRLLAAYDAEEDEHGFPFNFELRDAHRELRALIEPNRQSVSECAGFMALIPKCKTCNDTGWLCAHTDGPADFHNGSCCQPWESEFYPAIGTGCPSANGCPDCDAKDKT